VGVSHTQGVSRQQGRRGSKALREKHFGERTVKTDPLADAQFSRKIDPTG
jgi:hypothetical protein